jgi:hypothetical protein
MKIIANRTHEGSDINKSGHEADENSYEKDADV